MKPILPKIIDNAQTGFLRGRFIGERTHLIYDLLHYTDQNNIDGQLMLIDFKKAFDSISWKFLYQTLSYFGFTPAFI